MGRFMIHWSLRKHKIGLSCVQINIINAAEQIVVAS